MLDGRFLDRLTIRNGKVMAAEPMLLDMKSRIRHVAAGPDGAVYVLTDTGGSAMADGTPIGRKLLKLTPR